MAASAALLWLAACGGAAAPPAPEAGASERTGSVALIAEARWLEADADLVAALTSEPVECLAAPADAEAALKVEIGRAAFRAPALLGGQAARAGLSCSACHRNGRGNESFAFFGVSGAPGTADVTSSFFSSHRGDGVDNPVPIPDLAGPPDRLKVDRAPRSAALEAFIRGLVVEEFDGAEPQEAVLAGLAAYVRALAPEACPRIVRASVRVADRIEDARRAVEAARAAADADDAAAAELMLAAARAELGRIHARYAAAELASEREGLVASDRALAAAQEALRTGAEDIPLRLAAWRVSFDDLAAAIAEDEARSLFAPDVLSRALAERP
jgi:hypothetical protein